MSWAAAPLGQAQEVGRQDRLRPGRGLVPDRDVVAQQQAAQALPADDQGDGEDHGGHGRHRPDSPPAQRAAGTGDGLRHRPLGEADGERQALPRGEGHGLGGEPGAVPADPARRRGAGRAAVAGLLAEQVGDQVGSHREGRPDPVEPLLPTGSVHVQVDLLAVAGLHHAASDGVRDDVVDLAVDVRRGVADAQHEVTVGLRARRVPDPFAVGAGHLDVRDPDVGVAVAGVQPALDAAVGAVPGEVGGDPFGDVDRQAGAATAGLVVGVEGGDAELVGLRGRPGFGQEGVDPQRDDHQQ